MSELVKFDNLNLEVLEYHDTWALSNRQVAEGFGVSESTIREQKRVNEFREGVHFYLSENLTGNAKQTFWTKKGVITLGFKLRETPQTIAFRDWASDFIIRRETHAPTLSTKLTETIALLSTTAKERDEFRGKYLASLERENALLREEKMGRQGILDGRSRHKGRIPRPRTLLSSEEKAEILRLSRLGMPKSQIAREMHRSIKSVYAVLRSEYDKA